MKQRIGKYEVIRLIGCGGMAEVYEVLSRGAGSFEKRLCIKKIRKDHADSPDFVRSFETEAWVVSNLQHSNIVQVFEFSRDEKREPYLVMEYVDGLDLSTVLEEAAHLGLQVPIDFAVYVLESLLSALHHAHTLTVKGEPTPVIHRDISPHNLLLSVDGTVKLADFGIAKSRASMCLTQTGIIKGKLAYMSPEQASGGEVPITPSSDLFSSGVVFWELLTCERMFRPTKERGILTQVLNFAGASLPHYSRQINQFLSGLLAQDPAERFLDAETALLRLRKLGISPCAKEDAAKIVKGIKAHIQRQEEIKAEEKSAQTDKKKAVSKISLIGISKKTRPEESAPGEKYEDEDEDELFHKPSVGRRIAVIAAVSAVSVGALLFARLFLTSEPLPEKPAATETPPSLPEKPAPAPNPEPKRAAVKKPEAPLPQASEPVAMPEATKTPTEIPATPPVSEVAENPSVDEQPAGRASQSKKAKKRRAGKSRPKPDEADGPTDLNQLFNQGAPLEAPKNK